jgi:class 3 adenylate cyclase
LALENQRLESEVALAAELPVGLAERLQRKGNKIGESRTLQISVLMSDIRGYSTIAETANAQNLAAQLNEHRARMNKVIADAGGTIMQFAGDSVFAVFGAPEPTRDHAARAVQAALGMQSAQSELNSTWAGGGRPTFGLGIGVTTGEVAAALSGSAEHVEYSVVGDVVNLAQRLQAWAQPGQIVTAQLEPDEHAHGDDDRHERERITQGQPKPDAHAADSRSE